MLFFTSLTCSSCPFSWEGPWPPGPQGSPSPESLSWYLPHHVRVDAPLLPQGILPSITALSSIDHSDLFRCLSHLMCAQLLNWVLLFSTPWTVARQGPLSMRLSWQEYWSGLPFPFPGDLLDPGIEPKSLVFLAWEGGFCTTEPPGKPHTAMPYSLKGWLVAISLNWNGERESQEDAPYRQNSICKGLETKVSITY